jgi:hypothetical protein
METVASVQAALHEANQGTAQAAAREAAAVLGQALDRQGVALEGLDQRLHAERAQQSVSVPAGGVLGVYGVLVGPTSDVFGSGAAPALISSATLDSASTVSVFALGGAATLVAAATGVGAAEHLYFLKF